MPLTNCPVCKLGEIVSDEDQEDILICDRCGSIVKQTITGYIFTRVAREFRADAEKYMSKTFTEDDLIALGEEIALEPQAEKATAPPMGDTDVGEPQADEGAEHKPDLDRVIRVEESAFSAAVKRFMMPFILGFLIVVFLFTVWWCGSFIFSGKREGHVDKHQTGAVVSRRAGGKALQRDAEHKGEHEGIECPVCKKKFK